MMMKIPATERTPLGSATRYSQRSYGSNARPRLTCFDRPTSVAPPLRHDGIVVSEAQHGPGPEPAAPNRVASPAPHPGSMGGRAGTEPAPTGTAKHGPGPGGRSMVPGTTDSPENIARALMSPVDWRYLKDHDDSRPQLSRRMGLLYSQPPSPRRPPWLGHQLWATGTYGRIPMSWTIRCASRPVCWMTEETSPFTLDVGRRNRYIR